MNLRSELWTAAGVALALGAAIDALDLQLIRHAFTRESAAIDTLRGCLVVASLYACARRWPRVRGAVTLTLLAVAPLLPAWNSNTLHWLGATLVGGWGDASWELTAPELLLGERAVEVYSAATDVAFAACVSVALAAVIVARGIAALLARPAARNATLAALMAIPLLATTGGAVAQLTRAPFAHWWTAYPVAVRASASRVPHVIRSLNPAMREEAAPCLRLTPSLCASRVSYRALDNGALPTQIRLRFSPPPAPNGEFADGLYSELWCPDPRASLVVRTIATHDRALVTCEDPRSGLPWPTPTYSQNELSQLEARGYFSHVYTAEVLRVAAPPPWVSVASSLGALVALAALLRGRRSRQEMPLLTPYRSAASTEGVAADHPIMLLTDAFAIALSMQAAAPLVLAAWAQLLIFR